MRKNFGAKTYLYPMPVLIIATYNEDGTPNAMNAAWGGISDYGQVVLSLDKGHKTYKNIMDRKAFTISVGTAEQVVAEDYIGIVSGNKEPKKFERAGFHALRSEFVDAPIIEELPMTLECRLFKVTEDELVLGEIVNVNADERILGSNGQIDPTLLRPITYDTVNKTYIELGGIVGHAFKDGLKIK